MLPEISAIVREWKAGSIIGSRVPRQMAEAIGQMQHVPPALLAVLAEVLDWPFAPVRQAAASALGRCRNDIPDAAIHRLLAMRQEPDELGRAAADFALGQILS